MKKRAKTYFQITLDENVKRKFIEKAKRQNIPASRIIEAYMREHIRKVDEADGKPTDFNA